MGDEWRKEISIYRTTNTRSFYCFYTNWTAICKARSKDRVWHLLSKLRGQRLNLNQGFAGYETRPQGKRGERSPPPASNLSSLSALLGFTEGSKQVDFLRIQ